MQEEQVMAVSPLETHYRIKCARHFCMLLLQSRKSLGRSPRQESFNFWCKSKKKNSSGKLHWRIAG